MIQQAQGVPHGAAGLPGDQRQALLRDGHPLPPAEFDHVMHHLARLDAPQVVALAAGQNGDGDFVGFGGGEEKHHVGRRLLQRLEQRVEGRRAEHVDFVDDVDFEPAVGRHVADVFPQVADVVHAVVGGPVDFQHVRRVASGDLPAGAAGVARFRRRSPVAVHGLGEDAGDGGFAGAPGAREEDGVGHPFRPDGVGQRAGDVRLTHHVGEGLGTVFSGENQIGQRRLPGPARREGPPRRSERKPVGSEKKGCGETRHTLENRLGIETSIFGRPVIRKPNSLRRGNGGERGIRTLGAAINGTHDFQSCTFSQLGHLSEFFPRRQRRSRRKTSPPEKRWRRGWDSNPRSRL